MSPRLAFALLVLISGVLVSSTGAAERAAQPRELVFVSSRAAKLIRPAVYSVSEDGGRRHTVTRTFGSVQSVRWSPRGDRVAFVADGRLHVARPGRRAVVLAPRIPATDPAWSPDGTRLAFVAAYDLFVVGIRGRRPHRVARGVSSRPAWSPSGRSIAFTRAVARDGQNFAELWLLDVATGRQQRLLGPWSHANDPSWSPDGRRLTFEYSDGNADFHRIYLLDLEKRKSRRVAPRGFRPSWSPDGTLIAFTTQTAVYVMSGDGTHRRRIFRRKRGRERLLSVAWSPDSRRLAVAANEVYVIDVHRRRPWKQVTAERPRFVLADDEVSWASKGHRLAYVAQPYDPGDNDIYEAARNGKRLRALTQNWVEEQHPAWAPDGSRLAYTEYDGRRAVVAVLRPGRFPALIADGANPAWSPDGNTIAFDRGGDLFVIASNSGVERVVLPGLRRDSNPDWSPDGRELVFERAPDVGDYPAELWAVNSDGSGPRQITDVRRGRGRCEVTSASEPAWSPDGSEIAFALLEASGDCVLARGGRSIYAVKSDGSGDQRLIVRGPAVNFQDEAYSPAWSPDGASVAFVSDTDYGGKRIAIVARAGGGFRFVTARRDQAADPEWRFR